MSSGQKVIWRIKTKEWIGMEGGKEWELRGLFLTEPEVRVAEQKIKDGWTDIVGHKHETYEKNDILVDKIPLGEIFSGGVY